MWVSQPVQLRLGFNVFEESSRLPVMETVNSMRHLYLAVRTVSCPGEDVGSTETYHLTVVDGALLLHHQSRIR